MTRHSATASERGCGIVLETELVDPALYNGARFRGRCIHTDNTLYFRRKEPSDLVRADGEVPFFAYGAVPQ